MHIQAGTAESHQIANHVKAHRTPAKVKTSLKDQDGVERYANEDQERVEKNKLEFPGTRAGTREPKRRETLKSLQRRLENLQGGQAYGVNRKLEHTSQDRDKTKTDF